MTNTALNGPFATNATSAPRAPATVAPTRGMKERRNTSTDSGSASGTCNIASPIPIPTASTSATLAVPRTYEPRVPTVLSPMRSARSRASPSKGRSMKRQIVGPSFKKKNSTTIISTSPVTKLATAPTPARAPAPKFAEVIQSRSCSRHSMS